MSLIKHFNSKPINLCNILSVYLLIILNSVQITFSSEIRQESVINGDNLILICANDSNIRCKWLRNGGVIEIKGRYSSKTANHCHLHITQMDETIDGSKWSCEQSQTGQKVNHPATQYQINYSQPAKTTPKTTIALRTTIATTLAITELPLTIFTTSTTISTSTSTVNHSPTAKTIQNLSTRNYTTTQLKESPSSSSSIFTLTISLSLVTAGAITCIIVSCYYFKRRKRRDANRTAANRQDARFKSRLQDQSLDSGGYSYATEDDIIKSKGKLNRPILCCVNVTVNDGNKLMELIPQTSQTLNMRNNLNVPNDASEVEGYLVPRAIPKSNRYKTSSIISLHTYEEID